MQEFTCELPLWSILTPYSYTVPGIRHSSLLVDVFDSNSKVSPSPLHGTIVHPLEFAESLGCFFIWPMSKTIVVRLTISFITSQLIVISAYVMPIPVLSKMSWKLSIWGASQCMARCCLGFPSTRTLGSKVFKGPSLNLKCLYVALLPGCSVPGTGTE